MSHLTIFSHVVMGLPGYNQYYAEDKVSCSRTQCSACGEAQTHNSAISSKALYHCTPKTYVVGTQKNHLSFEHLQYMSKLMGEKIIATLRSKLLLTHISLGSFFGGTSANSAKPDQTPQNVASDQVLHCLQTEFSIKI